MKISRWTFKKNVRESTRAKLGEALAILEFDAGYFRDHQLPTLARRRAKAYREMLVEFCRPTTPDERRAEAAFISEFYEQYPHLRPGA